MKILALFLISLGLASAIDDFCRGDYLQWVYEQCLAEHGGDIAVINDLHQYRKAGDENGRCFRACIMQKCNYLDDDGKLYPDVPERLAGILHGGIEAHVKPIEEAVAKCVALQTYDDTFCNNAEKFTECVAETAEVPLKVFGIKFE